MTSTDALAALVASPVPAILRSVPPRADPNTGSTLAIVGVAEKSYVKLNPVLSEAKISLLSCIIGPSEGCDSGEVVSTTTGQDDANETARPMNSSSTSLQPLGVSVPAYRRTYLAVELLLNSTTFHPACGFEVTV